LILPTFGAMPMAQIDRLAVREWIAGLSASGRSPATVVKAVQIMGKVMKTAVAGAAIRSNPCADIPLPRIEREEMRFLDPGEVATLAESIDERYAALVWFGAYGGLRAGELFGLRARRIDPLRRRVAAGLTPVGIARRAGHTSVVTVQDRYGHLLPGTEDAADEALEAMARSAKPGSRTKRAPRPTRLAK
jgi:integrase